MLNKKELDKLLKIKGEVKSVVFQTDANYVLEKKGEEGLKKVEAKAKELGYNINYRSQNSLANIPIGLRVVSLLIIKDVFGWSDEDIRKMGYEAPKNSFVVKLFMRFFVSFAKFMEEVPNYWKEHYTIGELDVVQMDDDTKYAVMRLKNIKIHPLLCKYLEGYFERMYEFIIGGLKGECKETKCMFKGDPYHEYVLRIKK